MKKYLIKKAVFADVHDIKKIMHAAYSTYEQVLDGIMLPPMIADYEEEIRNYPTWVLDLNGQLIGALTMYFDENDAHLSNVAVDPRYKGQGYGKVLINFAENIAREKGYLHLSLVTHVKLSKNIDFYNKLGYKEIDRIDDKVYFEKVLM